MVSALPAGRTCRRPLTNAIGSAVDCATLTLATPPSATRPGILKVGVLVSTGSVVSVAGRSTEPLARGRSPATLRGATEYVASYVVPLAEPRCCCYSGTETAAGKAVAGTRSTSRGMGVMSTPGRGVLRRSGSCIGVNLGRVVVGVAPVQLGVDKRRTTAASGAGTGSS